MKKIIFHLTVAIFCFFTVFLVCNAATVPSFTGNSSITDKSAFTIKVHLSGDISNGLQGDLSYDSTKLTLKDPTGTVNGFTVSYNSSTKKLMSDNNANKIADIDVIDLVFTPTSSFNIGDVAKIELDNIIISDANGNSNPASKISYSITMKSLTDTQEPEKDSSTDNKTSNPETGISNPIIYYIASIIISGVLIFIIKKCEIFKHV